MHPFRTAVEAGDLDAMAACLSPDAIVDSPVAFKPFAGREAAVGLFSQLFEVFEDFRYTDELTSPDGTHVLVFRARVGERELQGVDLLRPGSGGLVGQLTVMIRPLSAIIALGEEMRARVEGLAKGEASWAAG